MKYLILYKSFLFCWLSGKLRQNLLILLITIVSVFSFLSAYSCFCNSDFEVNIIPDSNEYRINISNCYNDETINYISHKLPSVIYNRELNGYFYYQYKNTDYCELTGVLAVLNNGFKKIFCFNNNYSVFSGRDFTESELNECSNVIIVDEKSGFKSGDELVIPSDSGREIKLRVIGTSDKFILPAVFLVSNTDMKHTNPGSDSPCNVTLSDFSVFFERNLTDEELSELSEFLCDGIVVYSENNVTESKLLQHFIIIIVCIIAAVYTALQLYSQFVYLAGQSVYQIAVAKVTGCKDSIIVGVMLLLCVTYSVIGLIISAMLMPFFTSFINSFNLYYSPVFSDFIISFVIQTAIIVIAVLPGIRRVVEAPLTKGGI